MICTYQYKRLSSAKLALIEIANGIIEEYQEQGFVLTLRQLYYQFVARALLPNTNQSYALVGAAMKDGRLNGLVDWKAIEDRTRNLEKLSHWSSPASIVQSAADNFRLALWDRQAYYLEVWVEKEALAGVVERAVEEFDVPYLCCRGYMSLSEMKVAADRIREKIEKRKDVIILHLGDHDPSGIDMTRDIQDRLDMFLGNVVVQFEVKRIALNIDQVEEGNLPPNPTKMSDSRASDYCERFGEECWEIDALPPDVLVGLIQSEIKERIDQELWDFVLEEQEEGRAELQKFADDLRERG